MSIPKRVLCSTENIVASATKVASQPENLTVDLVGLDGFTDIPGDTGKTGHVPPKPPRTSFMCFADAKEKQIQQESNHIRERSDILKMIAEEWKSLSVQARAIWDEEARNDKLREKSEYKGPQLVTKRRAKKHPLAPKRPMSAFLKFSQTWRKRIKKENPHVANTDVSRLLGEMWRNASPIDQQPYREEEVKERAKYKENIKRFRDLQARKDAGSRTSHYAVQSNHELRTNSWLPSTGNPFNGETQHSASNGLLLPLYQQPEANLDESGATRGFAGTSADQDRSYLQSLANNRPPGRFNALHVEYSPAYYNMTGDKPNQYFRSHFNDARGNRRDWDDMPPY